MKVGNYPVNHNQPTGEHAGTNSIHVQTANGNNGVPHSLSSLAGGEIFEATITRGENGKITLHLGNGETITARMDGSVDLLENTATFFQVKSNQGNQVALRAVTQEAGANPTIIKALTQAGVAIDDANVRLVQEMMKQQLPIDAKSLAQMVRIAYGNKDIAPATLIQMTKLGLPITKENLTQFQQYATGKGDMVKHLDTFMKQLPQALERLDGEGISGKEVLSELKQIFQEGSNPQPVAETFAKNGEEALTDASVKPLAQGNTTAPAMVMSEPMAHNPEGNTRVVAFKEVLELLEQIETKGAEQQGKTIEESVGFRNGQTTVEIPVEETAESSGEQQKLPVELYKGKEGFLRVTNLIQSMDLSEAEFKTLFSQKGFQTLLRDTLEQEWLLTPEQVKEENISQVYEKLNRQMNKLESLLNQMGQSEQAMAGEAKDVRQQVQFIQDLNQFYNYVQIPLKMMNQNAKGDLYVYTDKRALKQGKEELTAHLHLELQHLGTTDVYVRLKEKKLTTNFIMEKEESLDLVMKNMDVLTERLQKKGYFVQATAELNGEESQEPDFMKEILNKELPSIAIQRYSLDVIV